jgi:hypothetical protein
MTWYPKYRLYENDNTTLVYTFDAVTGDNSPQDPIRYTEISGSRGVGSIIVPGSVSTWELSLNFILFDSNYANLIDKMDDLLTYIPINEELILKIDRTISTTKDYNVKRIKPISWEQSIRTSIQRGLISFSVNSW